MSKVGELKGLAREIVERSAVRLGLGHSEQRLERDAQEYWRGEAGAANWRNNSHFRDGSVFGADITWESVGQEHWELFERLARTTGFDGRIGTAVEWGCGGGANATAFAPHCEKRFVGVDIAQPTVDECEKQVAAATDVDFTGIVADVERPEAAAAQIGSCDLFLCLYVLELVPSPEYGLRLMRIAHDLLDTGGLAFVQVKYDTGSWRTAPRRRGYRGTIVASMTTYPIDGFWRQMTEIGLRPEACYLVPENALDSRYAYYLLRKI